MKQTYHHYTLWEDWIAGMYGREQVDHVRVSDAGLLLRDSALFTASAGLVVTEWKYATEHNLSDRSQNRRAWLGQASATYTTGATQTETCIAWNTKLTDSERHSANRIADTVIATWCVNAHQLEWNYA